MTLSFFIGEVAFGVIAFATGYRCCWASNRAEILSLRGDEARWMDSTIKWRRDALAARLRMSKLKDMHCNLMEAIENLETEEEVA